MQLSNEQWQAVNAKVIEEFRARGGHCGGHLEGNPLILLTTRGVRSGLERITPLTYTRDGDRIVVLASKGGAPTDPDWYRNLVADPRVVVEVDDERFPARAHTAQGPERELLFDRVVAQLPRFDEYRKIAGREIPVVVLTRDGGGQSPI